MFMGQLLAVDDKRLDQCEEAIKGARAGGDKAALLKGGKSATAGGGHIL
jgi:hypothetical protein